MAAATGIARADEPAASDVRVSFTSDDGWTYHPAMIEGAGGPSLVGLLATHDPASVPLGSVSVVWYPKGASGAYSMQLFTGTAAAAVASLSDAYATPTLFSHSSLSAGNATPWDDGELLTTTGGIADNDPASLIASLLPPGGVQLLVENGSTGATAISGEEVEIGSDGVPVSQERLKKVGDVLLTTVVLSMSGASIESTQAGFFGDDCTPGLYTASSTTCSGWSNSGTYVGGCLYSGTCTLSTTTCNISANCAMTGCLTTTKTFTCSAKCPTIAPCPATPPCNAVGQC